MARWALNRNSFPDVQVKVVLNDEEVRAAGRQKLVEVANVKATVVQNWFVLSLAKKSVNNVLYNLYGTFFIILYLSHQTTYTILHLLLMPHVKAIVYAVYRYQYILMFKSEQFYWLKKLCNKAFTNNNHCLKPITKIISPFIIGLTLINANGYRFWN